MFNRVFKKKDEPYYTDLARRSRVDKQKAAEYTCRRPSTAPSSSGIGSSAEATGTNQTVNHRHSMGEKPLTPHRVLGDPTYFPQSETSTPFSSSPTPSHPSSPAPFAFHPNPSHNSTARKQRTPSPPVTTPVSPCPRMVPQQPSGSNELPNPFRSNTNDSVCSMGRTESFESFADTGVPIHRTVRAFRQAPTTEDASHAPQRAAVFTVGGADGRHLEVPPATASAVSDPFTDSHACASSQPASPSVSTAGFNARVEETTAPRPQSVPRRWSLLKASKRGSQDFLQVRIPTGVMSPVRESRLAFWSKA